MSKHIDKILLGIAVLVCAGSGAFYAANQKTASQAQPGHPATAATPQGTEYKPIPLPPEAPLAAQWKAPVYDEDDAWAYDLFTPVESLWDNARQEYEAKGSRKPPPPFGVKLVSVSHPAYRLTLVSHIQLPKVGIDKSILTFVDSEKNDPDSGKPGYSFRAAKGKFVENENIEIKDFFIDKQPNPDGTSVSVPTAIVIDKSREPGKQEMRVTGSPIVFSDITNIIIARADDPAKTWTLHKIGDEIKDDELGTFTLKEIDFDAGSISLEKVYKKNPRKTTTVTDSAQLTVEKEPASAVSAKETEVTNK